MIANQALVETRDFRGFLEKGRGWYDKLPKG